MAHVYQLTDGTDTVILSAYTPTNPFLVKNWLLQTPTPSQMPAGAEGSDNALAPGNTAMSPRRLSLASLSISAAPVHVQVRRIQTMHRQGQTAPENRHGRKGLYPGQLDELEGEWRSEILAGRLVDERCAR